MTEDVAHNVATAADPIDSTEGSYDIPVSTPLGPRTVTVFTGLEALMRALPFGVVWMNAECPASTRFLSCLPLETIGHLRP